MTTRNTIAEWQHGRRGGGWLPKEATADTLAVDLGPEPAARGYDTDRQTVHTCTCCGTAAARLIAPYWQPDQPICPACCRWLANSFDHLDHWPEVA